MEATAGVLNFPAAVFPAALGSSRKTVVHAAQTNLNLLLLVPVAAILLTRLAQLTVRPIKTIETLTAIKALLLSLTSI